jgi:D-aspartate ligase
VSKPTGLMPAVLLGGTGTTLAVVRALGQAGVPVTILGDGRNDIVGRRSRFCSHYEHFPVPDGARPPPPGDRWLEWLRQSPVPSVILPCGDDGLELVARHRREMESVGHRAVEANDSVVLAMLDKVQTYRLASSLGIHVPRTVEVDSLDGARAAVDDGIGFPCAVKPVRSDRVLRQLPTLGAPKGAIVRDDAELCRQVEPIVGIGLPILVTEFISGPDDQFCSYYSYLDESGSPLFHFTKRKLRQFPPRFGTGTYHVTEWQPEVAEVGLHFFQGVGLRGLGNVEFKRDERDGQLKLIECNARFTMATAQVRRAGIDLALVAYARLTGQPLPRIDTFRDGVRLWCPGLDLRAMRQYRAAGELTTAQWVRSLAHRQHLSVFDLRDPLPYLAAVRGQLRSARQPPT